MAGLAFEVHAARVIEHAGTTPPNATREMLAAVSAYFQRLARQISGLGVTADGAIDEVIPVDRGVPGHGGPPALTD